MNKQKLSYTAPVAETFVVQAEGMICLSNPVSLLMTGDWGATDLAGDDLKLDKGFDLE